MRVVEKKPPGLITLERRNGDYKIFLAGTIDNGDSYDWQRETLYYIGGIKNNLVRAVVFNPRRESWDPSLPQSAKVPQFYQQVDWEMAALDQSDLIIMNFLPDSKSPISLLELGLYAASGKLIVCCPEKFWRAGNVDMVCSKYGIPLYRTYEELLLYIKKEFTK